MRDAAGAARRAGETEDREDREDREDEGGARAGPQVGVAGEADVAPASVAAMVRVSLADHEGREELRALRAVLRQGELSGESALGRLSQARDELVSVIIASSLPICVDVRDTLAFRIGGDAFAAALNRTITSRKCRVIMTFGRAINLFIGLSSLLGGSIDGRIWFGLTLVLYAYALVHLATDCVAPIASMVIRRFDFWYLSLHGVLIAVTGFVIMDDPRRGATVAVIAATVPLGLLLDSVAFSESNLQIVTFGMAMTWTLTIALVFFFRLPFGISQVNVVLFETTYSANDRFVGSVLCISIFFGRFMYAAVRSPGSLVILSGLVRARLPSAVVNDMFDAYSLQGRQVAAALPRPAPASLGKAAVAPAPQSQPQPPQQQLLAPKLQSIASAALLEASGDEAAARTALLRALDDVLRAGDHMHRRSSITEQVRISQRWAAAGEGEEGEAVAVLLPRFVPLIVNRDGTIAAALGGARLNELCRDLCGCPRFHALVLVVRAAASAITVYSLTGRGEASLVAALLALLALSLALDAASALQLNVNVLRSVVLKSFNTWWAMGNVLGAAISGAFLFQDPRLSTVWVLWQLHTTGSFFHDAAPPTASARRTTGLSLLGVALLQLSAVPAMWARVLVVQEYNSHVLNVPVGLLNFCVGAQLNVALLAARFAVRVLQDQNSLMIRPGLAHAQVPLGVARNLRAHMIALRVRQGQGLQPSAVAVSHTR